MGFGLRLRLLLELVLHFVIVIYFGVLLLVRIVLPLGLVCNIWVGNVALL